MYLHTRIQRQVKFLVLPVIGRALPLGPLPEAGCVQIYRYIDRWMDGEDILDDHLVDFGHAGIWGKHRFSRKLNEAVHSTYTAADRFGLFCL